jgi:hypothetical protein
MLDDPLNRTEVVWAEFVDTIINELATDMVLARKLLNRRIIWLNRHRLRISTTFLGDIRIRAVKRFMKFLKNRQSEIINGLRNIKLSAGPWYEEHEYLLGIKRSSSRTYPIARHAFKPLEELDNILINLAMDLNEQMGNCL